MTKATQTQKPTFLDIVTWASNASASSIECVVDPSEATAQVEFRIGGSYERPTEFNLPTADVIEILNAAMGHHSSAHSDVSLSPVDKDKRLKFEIPQATGVGEPSRVSLSASSTTDDGVTTLSLRVMRLGDTSGLIKCLPDDVDTSGSMVISGHIDMPGFKVIAAPSDLTSLKEIDMNQVMADRVRAGQPIYVAGHLDDVNAKLHAATVNRLMAETGLSVTVVHTPN